MKRVYSFLLIFMLAAVLTMTSACGAVSVSEPIPAVELDTPVSPEPETMEREITAVYLGVYCYGSPELWHDAIPSFLYRFFCGGEDLLLSIAPGEKTPEGGFSYEIQNRLVEGDVYALTVEDNSVTEARPIEAEELSALEMPGDSCRWWAVSGEAGGAIVESGEPALGGIGVAAAGENGYTDIYILPETPDLMPPVCGQPGLRTLKNFLQTALMPVGTTLYIQGAGRNWQNEGPDGQTTEIGLPTEWSRFFSTQDTSFTGRETIEADVTSGQVSGYYPYGGWNQYHYAGMDDDGYAAWAVYNTLETESGGTSYLADSCLPHLLTDRGFGQWSMDDPYADGGAEFTLAPGDVLTSEGGTWICVGVCPDGSVVILHCAPTDSRAGQPGGGAQIGAIGFNEHCQAYRLAEKYMSFCYPAWYERYGIPLLAPEEFYRCGETGEGHFRWYLDGEGGHLSDPDGYASLTPKEILRDLFGDLPFPEDEYIFGEPIPESDPVSPDWFDDAVFIGDSVTVSLRMFCNDTHALGNAQFLCENSLSATNALWSISSESVHPVYNGAKIRLEDGVAACGAKNVYIMLGINNISFGVENAAQDMLTVIRGIEENAPDVHIFIETVTPMTVTSSIMGNGLNNDRIAEYNERMRQLCEENGWYYLDLEEVFRDADGYLISDYCSDPRGMGIHFNNTAAQVWVDYLLTHVPESLQ